MGTIYGSAADQAGDGHSLPERLRADRDATTGVHTYDWLVALGLMAFYVFALMCTSTLAVTVRETGGGWQGVGWATLQFCYMLALAYGVAFVVYRGGLALGFGGGT
jgi:ferrous iron transport protein B